MEIIIFILVIVALIVVHEFGHFVAAKLSGMRVDEFGIGYPPRALVLGTIGETKYTLNWLPFGGFVKIYGEDGKGSDARSFSARPRILQAIVLVAGVAMNLVFAYILITGALISGTPRALGPSEMAGARDVQLAVANVLPGSPAARAGLVPGDIITSASDTSGTWSVSGSKSFSSFVTTSDGSSVTLSVKTGIGDTKSLIAQPVTGLITSDPSRYAIGVEVAPIGIVPISFSRAITYGATLTWSATTLTATELAHFFYGIFTFSADLSQVAGPIGIVRVVGSAAGQGFGDLLSLMAIISINLALINLIPIPALDGGRLLFVIIESITRRRIKVKVTQIVNGIGFALLILLMVVVSINDVFRLIG